MKQRIDGLHIFLFVLALLGWIGAVLDVELKSRRLQSRVNDLTFDRTQCLGQLWGQLHDAGFQRLHASHADPTEHDYPVVTVIDGGPAFQCPDADGGCGDGGLALYGGQRLHPIEMATIQESFLMAGGKFRDAGWRPIQVDDQGRVICSPQVGKP